MFTRDICSRSAVRASDTVIPRVTNSLLTYLLTYLLNTMMAESGGTVYKAAFGWAKT